MYTYSCEVCEQEFSRERPRVESRRKFCSAECRQRFYNKQMWEKQKPPSPEPRACEVCETVFTPQPWQPWAVTCGQKCNAKRQNAKKRERNRTAKEERTVQKECLECGTPFTTDNQRKIYCSADCGRRVAARRYAQSAKGRKYSKTKHKQLKTVHWKQVRLMVLERDGHSCRVCQKTDKRLEVHHLQGTEEGARRNSENPDDLMTLCAACHRKMHRISVVYVGGNWMVSGEVFEMLGLTGSIIIQEGSAS